MVRKAESGLLMPSHVSLVEGTDRLRNRRRSSPQQGAGLLVKVYPHAGSGGAMMDRVVQGDPCSPAAVS
jgi:hypothetical protein